MGLARVGGFGQWFPLTYGLLDCFLTAFPLFLHCLTSLKIMNYLDVLKKTERIFSIFYEFIFT